MLKQEAFQSKWQNHQKGLFHYFSFPVEPCFHVRGNIGGVVKSIVFVSEHLDFDPSFTIFDGGKGKFSKLQATNNLMSISQALSDTLLSSLLFLFLRYNSYHKIHPLKVYSLVIFFSTFTRFYNYHHYLIQNIQIKIPLSISSSSIETLYLLQPLSISPNPSFQD